MIDLLAIPLPEPVAAAILAMVSGRATGNVTIHFRGGEVAKVDSSRELRAQGVVRPAVDSAVGSGVRSRA